MADRFAIYHNIPKTTDIKIHHIDCAAYARRDSLQKTRTGILHRILKMLQVQLKNYLENIP